jgi:DNA-binding response OmpR family regulator/predicted HAD superfamily Cof-like phosphohydrolase
MNEPPPDEKEIENIIDIFILSSDEKVTLQLMEHLAQRDYRVTVFTSSDELNQTLYSGKPNLLICDSTTEVQEGFEVCRYIKADNDLWVIPVLLLTTASTLRDLLNTLDSNADNFIAQPYYLPYFLLLVEGMLATPVERQTPDQIKTQFKISHDEQTYVVAANRKKLLEYLLSAFEIAVNKSSELAQVNSELHALLESVKDLERSVTGHTNVIEVLNVTINQKEQKIAALVRVSEEQSRALAQKTEEIENLLREQDEDKTLIATRDETIRTIVRNQEEERAANRSKTDTFNRRISSLENESDTLKAHVNTLQNALNEETTRSTSQETALCTLTLNYEQQQSAFIAEKKRSESAEREIAAVVQAKSESEQDLTRIITDLNTTAKHQVAEVLRLKGETDALNQQISSLEDESDTLKAHVNTLQNSLNEETTRSTSQETALCTLTLNYEQQQSAFIAEKKRSESAEREIAAVMQAKSESEQDLTRIITDLNTTAKHQVAEVLRLKGETDALNQQVGKLQENFNASTAALENESGILNLQKERFEELLAEKEKTECQLQSVLQELTQAQDAVACGEQKRVTLASNLGEVIADKEKTEQTIKSLSAALDRAKSEIEFEREERRSIEETLERTTKERDNALEMLRHEYDTIQTDLDSNKMTLAERERDLEATIAIREALENDLDAIKVKNSALEEELTLASHYRSQSGQQSRTLSDELEQVKAALETERRLRRISEEKAKAATQQQEDLEQHLRSTHDEMERAKKDRDATLLRFKDELETTSHQITALEEQVSALERKRTDEAEEFRRERADAQKDNVQLAVQPEPHLPVPVEHVSQSLTVEIPPQFHVSPVSSKDLSFGEKSQDTPRVFSGVIQKVSELSVADDIFLEPSPGEKATGPSLPRDAADEHPVLETSPELSFDKPYGADDENEPSGLVEEAKPEREGEEEPEECGEEAGYEEQSDVSPDELPGQVPLGGFSFNRNQWMDLLKWAHHSGALSQDQRLKIVRMGRLIQKDRKLTKKQQDQIREIIAFVYAQGYRPQ